MKVEVKSGIMETQGPISFFVIPENDAAIQVTDDRIDIYFGHSKVGEISFRDKREMNYFFKNRGIEMRGRRATT